MKFFNLFNKSQKPEPFKMEVKGDGSSFHSFALKYDYSKPFPTPQKNGNGFPNGTDNLFPDELNNLYHSAPLHSAILDFKKLLTVGNGFSADTSSIAVDEQISFHQLSSQFEDMITQVGQDYHIHSTINIEVLWNSDNTKILKLTRLAPEKIRIADVDSKMNPTHFFYSWDWTNLSKYPKRVIPVFDQSNKKDKVQLFQFQIESAGRKLYTDPSYKSGLNWVFLDSEMAAYHTSNIQNSLNPSMLIEFFKMPETEEQKASILRGINQSFGGARKTGRAMVMFNDGVEGAAKVEQLNPNQLDKTFLSLTDTIQRQICYAHKIDPILLGLKTPGSLGGSADKPETYRLFFLSIIKPAQKDIEKILNKFLSINGLSTKIKLLETELFIQKTA